MDNIIALDDKDFKMKKVWLLFIITKTRLFKCIEKITSKIWKFSDKKKQKQKKTLIFFKFVLKT